METPDKNASPMVSDTVTLPVLATSIIVSTTSGKNTITTKSGTLQLLAKVLPKEASQDVTWSIVSGSGATISASGLLTAIGNGTVTVRATATDGTDIYGQILITISGQSSSGPSTGGGSSSDVNVSSVPEKKPNLPVTVTASFEAIANEDGTARATIPDKTIIDAITRGYSEAKIKGKTQDGVAIELNGTKLKDSTSLILTLSNNSLSNLVNAGVTSLKITGGPVDIQLDLKALQEIQKQSNGDITISITPVKKLSKSAKAKIGNRPAYDITISTVKNGKVVVISDLKGGSALISIPYVSDDKEAAGYLYGVYVDKKGNPIRMDDSAYDTNTGKILISTGHLSIYGVGYEKPSSNFTDIKKHWAKDAMDYIVSRGLITGTSKATFKPNEPITRGTLVTALGKLSKIDESEYKISSFEDVKVGSDVHPYIEWAYKNQLIQEVGKGMFEPERTITRQELALILYNYSKVTGYNLPITRTEVTFADNNSIGSAYKEAVKVMQQAGVLIGDSNNRFYPESFATRAETAAILTRYIKMTIDPKTTLGWVKNDSGQWMYYFYSDGTLARNTYVDGYEVDLNGVRKTK